jgi:hypothetical protein
VPWGSVCSKRLGDDKVKIIKLLDTVIKILKFIIFERTLSSFN